MRLITFLVFLQLIGDLNAQIQLKNVYVNNYSAPIGSVGGVNYREGGFSSLCVIPETDGTLFYTLSDRGVNIDSKNANCIPSYDKIFPFPSYSPKIFKVKVAGDSVQILQTISLKRPDGSGATGLINPSNFGSLSSEIPWREIPTDCANSVNQTLPKDSWGIDSEGLSIGSNNDFWICDEGGPTIWNVDAEGKVKKRYTPYAHQTGSLPEDFAIDTVFKYRKNNRGFEGVTLTPNGKVYALMQSPILFPNKTDGEKSTVHRILEIDPESGISRMFAYLNPGEVNVGSDVIKAKDWKIGDLVAINDTTFLVIEQAVKNANIQRKIYKISIKDATPISSALYNGKTVEQLKNAAGLSANGIVPVRKSLFLDLRANAWPDSSDKCEGLTIINDSTIALCNDDDFGQTSPTENGIAQATNIKCKIYVYGLKGANKISNYSANNRAIINSFESVKTKAQGISIYPVLVKDFAFISLKDEKPANTDIYSLSGILVKSLRISGSCQIDLNNLSKGYYTIKVVSGKSNFALKFIKE